MGFFQLSSATGLTIQCAGIVLITVLSFFMRRSIRRVSLDYWTLAWACLSLSLSALFVAFSVASLQVVAYPLYLLGEYGFGYMFLAGCRNYASGSVLQLRHLRMFIPGVVIAAGLPRLTTNFTVMFIPHAVIVAALFIAALFALRPARKREKRSPGLGVMSVALALLTIDFLQYVPAFSLVALADVTAPLTYLRYTSVYEVILETLLGFGTVIVVMEDVRREVEAANLELTAARDRLEIIARLDPLTEALNRHAFYSFVEQERDTCKAFEAGCVVVVDVDNLKPINDSFGHAAGDAAIRAVAKAIRSIIRPDDMLFRWGGDEFLVVLFNVQESEVQGRVEGLNAALDQTVLPGHPAPFKISVSYGLASFASGADLEQAIERADDAMYDRKESRKSHQKLKTG